MTKGAYDGLIEALLADMRDMSDGQRRDVIDQICARYRSDEPNRHACAWLSQRCCADCDYPVVVTQATDADYDYAWYCASPLCVRHAPENTGDMDHPSWAVRRHEVAAVAD